MIITENSMLFVSRVYVTWPSTRKIKFWNYVLFYAPEGLHIKPVCYKQFLIYKGRYIVTWGVPIREYWVLTILNIFLSKSTDTNHLFCVCQTMIASTDYYMYYHVLIAKLLQHFYTFKVVNCGTVEPQLSKSLLSEPSVIQTLMNVEIPKDSSIFHKTK